MKTWFITLTLLCAAALAQADGMPGNTAAAGAESASAPARPQTRHKAPSRKFKRLPTGDLRHCLESGSNEEIIRCAETPLKQ